MKKRKNVASKLRHRLTLEQETKIADGAGGYVRGWEEVAGLWGEITPIGGAERLESGKLQTPVRVRILLRHRGDITPAMRLVYDSRVFNIRSVINVQERDYITEILAEEGVA